MRLEENMKYCDNCGANLKEGQEVCLECGKVLVKNSSKSSLGTKDEGGFKWGLLGFCIPIVGLILYLIWKDEKPLNARAAGKGALIGFIIGIIGAIIQGIIIGSMY